VRTRALPLIPPPPAAGNGLRHPLLLWQHAMPAARRWCRWWLTAAAAPRGWWRSPDRTTGAKPVSLKSDRPGGQPDGPGPVSFLNPCARVTPTARLVPPWCSRRHYAMNNPLQQEPPPNLQWAMCAASPAIWPPCQEPPSRSQQAGRQPLVLLDEVGAGTDPGEGAALAIALLRHSGRIGARLTLATTPLR